MEKRKKKQEGGHLSVFHVASGGLKNVGDLFRQSSFGPPQATDCYALCKFSNARENGKSPFLSQQKKGAKLKM